MARFELKGIRTFVIDLAPSARVRIPAASGHGNQAGRLAGQPRDQELAELAQPDFQVSRRSRRDFRIAAIAIAVPSQNIPTVAGSGTTLLVTDAPSV